MDVGSLFVPSRVSAVSRNPRQPTPTVSPTTSPTACRIASVQRQPSFQDEMGSTGLLLPPQQQLVCPGKGAMPSASSMPLQLAQLTNSLPATEVSSWAIC
jgi:hypothetical protein